MKIVIWTLIIGIASILDAQPPIRNYGVNSTSTAVGTLTIGTVTAGTSFTINSLSATNTVVTGDLASICWQIN